ncbi:hypothetical protein GCM10025771_04340 [Niveibacterium umoris]
MQFSPAGLQFVAARLHRVRAPPRVRLIGCYPPPTPETRPTMNGSTLFALLVAAAILLLVNVAFGSPLPPFPGTHSGIVAVSAAPILAHKAC